MLHIEMDVNIDSLIAYNCCCTHVTEALLISDVKFNTFLMLTV